MILTKPCQQLQRDLKEVTFALEGDALDTFHKAHADDEPSQRAA